MVRLELPFVTQGALSVGLLIGRLSPEAANEEVLKVHTEGLGAKRLPYLKAKPAQKALVGKYIRSRTWCDKFN